MHAPPGLHTQTAHRVPAPHTSAMSTPPPATFLTLPVELRLLIAEYALEQDPKSVIPYPCQNQSLEAAVHQYRHYRPSSNLSLLLVCRQFNTDFTSLAYAKTTFALQSANAILALKALPIHKLRAIRTIAFIPGSEISHWNGYPFGIEALRLDTLIFLWHPNFSREKGFMKGKICMCNSWLYIIMRYLTHISSIHFLFYEGSELLNGQAYSRFIRYVLRDDYVYLYSNPRSPKRENTWWEWESNEEWNVVTFAAKGRREMVGEEEYMVKMRPLREEWERVKERIHQLWEVEEERREAASRLADSS